LVISAEAWSTKLSQSQSDFDGTGKNIEAAFVDFYKDFKKFYKNKDMGNLVNHYRKFWSMQGGFNSNELFGPNKELSMEFFDDDVKTSSGHGIGWNLSINRNCFEDTGEQDFRPNFNQNHIDMVKKLATKYVGMIAKDLGGKVKLNEVEIDNRSIYVDVDVIGMKEDLVGVDYKKALPLIKQAIHFIKNDISINSYDEYAKVVKKSIEKVNSILKPFGGWSFWIDGTTSHGYDQPVFCGGSKTPDDDNISLTEEPGNFKGEDPCGMAIVIPYFKMPESFEDAILAAGNRRASGQYGRASADLYETRVNGKKSIVLSIIKNECPYPNQGPYFV